MVTKPACLSCGGQCNRTAFIVCAMLLQDYECRSAASNTRLSQQDSAAGGQQERFDDLTQHLSETACEASDLGHQVDILESSRMVCCNPYHLSICILLQ